MGAPVSQMAAVLAQVLRMKLRGGRRLPLVLMLEPLYRCNLACPGCGKVRRPPEVLRRTLSPEACFRAARQCGAPIVSICGGEPLLHPEIERIAAGLAAQRRFVYLCTNGLKLRERLDRFRPSPRLIFNVHLDGPEAEHDRAVGRRGAYGAAVAGIRAARRRGFRVTINTTLFAGADAARIRGWLNEVARWGVEGVTISPGYAYAAAEGGRFLGREAVTDLFRRILARPRGPWRLNQTPLFLEFLQGRWSLDCAPWAAPAYNVLGWQRPCYLLDEGWSATYDELVATTDWGRYGPRSGNPKCLDCMVHCGFEPSAVAALVGSWAAWRAVLRGWTAAAVARRRPSSAGRRGETIFRVGQKGSGKRP